MALQSQLFAGDQKLEAAATVDSAHITPGATGDHVRKIQQALIELDGANINADGVYGPATAAAVLAFKMKRNIVNRAYQTQPDNIVGKMTMAALDAEMLQKERETPEENCCRLELGCPCDVTSRPVMQLGFAISAGTLQIAAAAPATPAEMMAKAFRDSRRSLRQAVNSLNALIFALMTRAQGKGDLSDENKRVFNAAKKWLILRTREDQISAVAHIATAVSLMNRNLTVKTSAGADPPLTAVSGNFHGLNNGTADFGVQCGRQFFSPDGPHCRRDVVTHECFHMFGVKHGGSPLNRPTIRSIITTPALSLDSADNLAQLVAEITTRGGRTDACVTAGE